MFRIALILVLTVACSVGYGISCNSCVFADDVNACTPPDEGTSEKPANLDQLLGELSKQTEKLKSYDANIVSAFVQPLLEAQTIRRGKIYYIDNTTESKLRINFLTRQDDETAAQSDRQDYMFDGVWLLRVNHTTSHVEKRQLAPADKPRDVLGLVSANFPLIGFSNIDKLKKDFDVELIEATKQEKAAGLMHVKLVPVEDTKFSEEYLQIDFWVDTDAMLPVRIDSLTVEEDIYQLYFEDFNINEKIAPENFELDYPENFTVEVKTIDD